ncbi:DUF2380 domain-containing protein [uncultured Roseibium sp.]|uniref:DUF2380 domain-containing protein n=1 Tax=uncultured Roseibium sp. TaxID=1936171 RepID=UPI00321724FA
MWCDEREDMPLRSIFLTLAALVFACPATAATLGVMPVKMLDTSGEVTDQSVAHGKRIDAVKKALERDLEDRYSKIVMIPSQDVAAACPKADPQCLLDIAAAAGADKALFVSIVKTSTLIMRMYVQIVDVPQKTVAQKRELNFRGDTDESWQRAERFLVRNLKAP